MNALWRVVFRGQTFYLEVINMPRTVSLESVGLIYITSRSYRSTKMVWWSGVSGWRCPSASLPQDMDMDRGFYRKVDVPDHAHYVIAFFVLIIGVVGVTGNALVMYAFLWYVPPSFTGGDGAQSGRDLAWHHRVSICWMRITLELLFHFQGALAKIASAGGRINLRPIGANHGCLWKWVNGAPIGRSSVQSCYQTRERLAPPGQSLMEICQTGKNSKTGSKTNQFGFGSSCFPADEFGWTSANCHSICL